MTTSDTQLSNRALAAIGSRSDIASLDENSAEANACNLLYDPVRLELLRFADWNFARQIATLTLIGTSPLITGIAPTDTNPIFWSFMPWAYEYAYPADCIAFRYVIPVFGISPFPQMPMSLPSPYTAVRHEIIGDKDSDGNDIRAVVTNLSQACGRYTKNVTNPDLFDPDFQDALVGRLASKLAVTLSGNLSLAKGVIEVGQMAEARARAADANENIVVQENIPDWLAVRGWSQSWAPGVGAYAYEYPLFPFPG